MKKCNKWTIATLASFFLPIGIMFFGLLSMGISYNGEKTILASDAFHQYVIFAQTLRNILHGSDSLFYTFTSGLGLNFYALISYYLGSFLSPFVFFFDLVSMPDAIYLFTLIKFGLMGLSASFSFHKLYPQIKTYLIISISVSYSLMSFLTSQLELNSWLDVFILLPLILLGLNRILIEKKTGLYYLSLSILFIQNYYFGYMVAIFLFFYSLVCLLKLKSLKMALIAFARFTVMSICAALTSAIMLLPTYLDLSSYGESFSRIKQIVTENAWYLDLPAKLSLGVYDTTKFNALPMIYVGLLPLLLSIIYFTLTSISWKSKLANGLLLIFIISSFYLQPLDLFWQGMHEPNMFLHRYAWTFSVLIILLACEALSKQEEFTSIKVSSAFIFLSLILVTPHLIKQKYEFLTLNLFFLSIAFLLAYTILLIKKWEDQIPIPFLVSFTLLFTSLEAGLNTYYQLNGINQEWVFPTRQSYNNHLKDIDNLVKQVSKNNQSFFRIERLSPQTGNDSMKYNYHGISQFSSIRNRLSSSLMDRLGFQSSGTNLNLRYQNNTLIMDSLLGIKYNLSQESLTKFGFINVKKSGNMILYQNNYSSPLAILTNNIYKDVNLSVNTLDNQTKLLNQLSGKSLSYYQLQPSRLISGAKEFNQRISGQTSDSEQTTIINYQVSVPKRSQMYVSIPDIIFSNPNAKGVSIRIDGHTYHYTTDNAFSFFDLGYFEEAKSVTLSFIFPKNKHINFKVPHFYSLAVDPYLEAIKAINQKKVIVHTKTNHIITDYNAKTGGSLIFTIPYDKGWSAKKGNQSLPITKAQGGFLQVTVPKGKSRVVLTFVPNGFKLGSFLSCFGIILYFLLEHVWFKPKNYKNKKKMR
ncbi:YfhO family protein [Streptococcus castoreus]|uniref:YfhO family protein n=1 Tax=Streptococcus castoreus TaxID=254786 RepID=UPI0004189920|nr:YfhO family protein [Streptococcus castoreus]